MRTVARCMNSVLEHEVTKTCSRLLGHFGCTKCSTDLPDHDSTREDTATAVTPCIMVRADGSRLNINQNTQPQMYFMSKI